MTNWQAGLVIAAVLQAIILAGAIIRRRERPANRPLALALLVLAGMLVVYPLGWHGHAEVPVWLAFFPANLPLALGPLLYLHVRGAAGRPLPPRPWLHFVPALGQFLYLVTLSALPAAWSSTWKESVHDAVVKPWIEAAVLLSLGGYSLAGLASLSAYRRRLGAVRSDVDRHDGRWIARLLATLLISLALLAGVRVYTTFIGELDGSVYLLWLAAWCAWLGIEGWRVAAIAPPALPDERDAVARAGGPARDWCALGTDWQARTRAAGWWREPDLTLAALARRIGTNSVYLSRAINEGLEMNFNEMVNRLRAEEVARVLRDEDASGDLLALALEAGFSSKATFNRSFRASFGISPSEYRRRLRS